MNPSLLQERGSRPPAVPGSVATHHYFDRDFDCTAVKLLPAEYYVTDAGILLTTVLGSCVAACITDVEAGVAGMNHFMLPDDADADAAVGGEEDVGDVVPLAGDVTDGASVRSAVDGCDVVINLAGRSVNCRYTAANRDEIMQSRVLSTRVVGQAIAAEASSPPRFFRPIASDASLR